LKSLILTTWRGKRPVVILYNCFSNFFQWLYFIKYLLYLFQELYPGAFSTCDPCDGEGKTKGHLKIMKSEQEFKR
jgi:hypothetical protein